MAILTTHVGSLPRPKIVSDLLFSRENNEKYDQQQFDDIIKKSVEEIVKKQIIQTKAGLLPKYKEQTIVDICGGRGGHLFAYMVIAKKYKVDFSPKNVYYNDIKSIK